MKARNKKWAALLVCGLMAANMTVTALAGSIYEDEADLGTSWAGTNISVSSDGTGDNATNVIKMTAGADATYSLEARDSGVFTLEYEVYGGDGQYAFTLDNSKGESLVNVSGSPAGNFNLVSEHAYHQNVGAFIVGGGKQSWRKVQITVDLDASNASGVLNFKVKVLAPDDKGYAGADTVWVDSGEKDQNAYVSPAPRTDGNGMKAPHANGAATDGITKFDIASIHVILADRASSFMLFDNINVLDEVKTETAAPQIPQAGDAGNGPASLVWFAVMAVAMAASGIALRRAR